jgi:UDP-N-acetylmuramate--alanine ligase
MTRYHFSGIAGAGMNPLAQLMRSWGHAVQGSDRSLDQGKQAELAARLRAQGITLLPQDGRAIHGELDRFVYSTAVEQETPEVLAAKKFGVELVPRPTLLAEVVNAGGPGIAIAGTSGKSTVTGMVAWILQQAKYPATMLGGAALAGQTGGGFQSGPQGGIVVAEACESDGTLIGYRPAIGLIHNISRDHQEVDVLHQQFDQFARQSALLLVNAGCLEACKAIHNHPQVYRYGQGITADYRLDIIAVGPDRAQALVHIPGAHEVTIDIPQPGAHNLDNACAAFAITHRLGLAPDVIVAALATFPGVARRFEIVGVTDSGMRVVDDYAHNGEKIRAVIQAAQAGCERLVAVFQPHGFGPARFLRPELKELLPSILRPQDRFCYSEIFYAGGNVAKDMSSRDLAADLPYHMHCGYAASHQEVLSWVAEQAIPHDTVLIMGARDPELPKLARAVYDLL